MTTYFTADTHFNHLNILAFEPDARPFADVTAMNGGGGKCLSAIGMKPFLLRTLCGTLGDGNHGRLSEWSGRNAVGLMVARCSSLETMTAFSLVQKPGYVGEVDAFLP